MTLYHIYSSTMDTLNSILWDITFKTLGGEIANIVRYDFLANRGLMYFIDFLKERLFLLFILIVIGNLLITLFYTKICKIEYHKKTILKNICRFVLFSCFLGEILLSIIALFPIFSVLYSYTQNFKECIKKLRIPFLVLNTVFCLYFLLCLDNLFNFYNKEYKSGMDYYLEEVYNPLHLKF